MVNGDISDCWLSSSASLLCNANDLKRLLTDLGQTVDAGAAACAIRDPENRAKVTFRLLPAIPASDDFIVNRQLTIWASSALVTAGTEQILRDVVSALRAKLRIPDNRWQVAGVSGDTANLDGTLSGRISEGDVYVLLSIRGRDGELPDALATISGTVYLSAVSCSVSYQSGKFWGRDCWSLGSINNGDCDAAKARLDEMADRQKISEGRAASIADWLDAIAEHTRSIPRLAQ